MELISREELINKINAYMVTTPDVTMVRKLINECKTIESRPKGKWLDNPPDSWICSNCGTHYEERLTFKAHKYCAVCGAEMEREE